MSVNAGDVICSKGRGTGERGGVGEVGVAGRGRAGDTLRPCGICVAEMTTIRNNYQQARHGGDSHDDLRRGIDVVCVTRH